MKRKPYHRFTPEQTQFLADWFKGRPEGGRWRSVELARLFNERFGLSLTPMQIWSKCFHSGLYKTLVQFSPTPAQAAFLERHANACPMAELTRRFNQEFGSSVSFSQIKYYTRGHGLLLPNGRRRWTPEEEAFLRENYVKGRRKELLARFNRRFQPPINPGSLAGKLNSLGVYRRAGLAARPLRPEKE
jgi:hypothetical protein